MGSDEGSRDRASYRSRRRKDEDPDTSTRRDDDRERQHRRRRSRDRSSDRRRPRRDRSESESREPRRRERKRSRSPDTSTRKRSRSRQENEEDEERRRGRDRHRDRRDRHREKESGRERHRRKRSPEDDVDGARPRRGRREEEKDSDFHGTKRRESPFRRNAAPLPSQNDSFAVAKGDIDEPPKPKEKPNFKNSGMLAAASNAVQQADGSTITLKYHEPPEARKPPAKDEWKLFIFKGEDVVDTVPLSQRSCWLIGRETAVVDMPADHPSLSKQHAVIQFRHVEKRNEYGDRIGRVKPYLIDLESANGTVLNGKKIADSRYVEIRDKDVIKLGHSTREYVLMLAPRG